MFDFLSRMVEECELIGPTDAQDYVVLPQFLTGKDAKIQIDKKRSSLWRCELLD